MIITIWSSKFLKLIALESSSYRAWTSSVFFSSASCHSGCFWVSGPELQGLPNLFPTRRKRSKVLPEEAYRLRGIHRSLGLRLIRGNRVLSLLVPGVLSGHGPIKQIAWTRIRWRNKTKHKKTPEKLMSGKQSLSGCAWNSITYRKIRDEARN